MDLGHSQAFGPLDGGLPPLTSSPNTDRYSSGTGDDSSFTKGTSFSSTIGGESYFDTIDAKQQSGRARDGLDARAHQWYPTKETAQQQQQQQQPRNAWPHYLPEELSSMSEAEWKAR